MDMPRRRDLFAGFALVLACALAGIVLSVPVYGQIFSSSARRYLQATFANLGTPLDGDVRFCIDCTATSPCAGSGTGAYAYRVGSAWNCNTGASGSGTVTSVGNGTIGGLFSASWATATTTPALSLNFAAAAANCLIAGPTSGGNAVPTCRAFVTADLASAVAPVANGGTGRSTLTANYVLLGNATTAVQMIAPQASGNVLTSDGTTWASSAPASASAPFADSNTSALVQGTADATKKFGFNLAAMTTGTTVTESISGTGTHTFAGAVVSGVIGTAAAPAFRVGGGTSAGWYIRNLGEFNIVAASNDCVEFNSSLGFLTTTNCPVIGWTGSATAGSGNRTGLSEVAAGIVGVGSGGSAAVDGWLVDGGECFVASDQTNATTTMASTTCSVTLKNARKYAFVCELFLSDSVAADGAKIDFNGGAATMTNFRAQVTAFDTALNLSSQVTAISTASSATTFTGAGAFEIHGSIEPSSNGTWIPRFAQAGHTTGTLTLARGSHCTVRDTP